MNRLVLTTNLVFSLIFPLSISTFFTACTGSHIEMNGVSTAKAKSLNPVVPITLNAEQAATLIRDSKDENELNAAIDRIETEAAYNIDWNVFWDAITDAPQVKKSGQALFERLALIDQRSCRQDYFKSYARYVIKTKRGYEYLAGDKRKCRIELGEDLSAQVLKSIKVNFEYQDGRYWMPYISLFYAEENEINPTTNLSQATKVFTSSEWIAIARTLIGFGKGDLLVRLVQAHRSTGIIAPFAKEVGIAILKDSEALERSVSSLGFGPTMRVLNMVPRQVFVEQGSTTVAFSLKKLAELYKPEALGGLPLDRLTAAFVQYLDWRTFERSVDDMIALRDSLASLEIIQRTFETFIFKMASKDSFVTKSFIDDLSTETLDGLWFKFRTQHKIFPELFGVSSAAFKNQTNKTEQAFLNRLMMHFSETNEQRRNSISAFCNFLRSEDIEVKSTNASQLETGLTAGCFNLNSSVTVQSSKNIKMSFDSVLFTNGNNLEVNAAGFDGSVIDASATQEHTALAGQQIADSNREHNGLLVPLVLGLKVEPGKEVEKGYHYFIFNFPYYFPKKGPKAIGPDPLPGYAAGSIDIRVTNPATSFAPTAISQGGKGQKGVPQTEGGKGDYTRIDWFKVTRWIDDLNLAPEIANSGMPLIFEDAPNTSELRTIIHSATRVNDDLDVYVDPSYLKLLESTERLKIHTLCKSTDDAVLRVCLKQEIGLKAIRWLNAELEKYQSTQDEGFVLEYMKPSTTLLPASAGDPNPDGPKGQDGAIEFQGFEQGAL